MEGIIKFCRQNNACSPAVEWLEAGNFPDLQTAWDVCPCGTWMSWWLGRTLPGLQSGGDLHRRLVHVAVECGRLALPYAGECRPQQEEVYSALERWCDGDNVDLQAVTASARAAAASARATAASAEAAYYSARATYYSAEAAYYSALAAYYSARATYYSAEATYYSAEAAAASAEAAADSAEAAAASAEAAINSARAAYYSAEAAYYSAWAAAEIKIAEIIRKYFPKPKAVSTGNKKHEK